MALKKLDLPKGRNFIRIENTTSTDYYINRINPHDEVYDGFEMTLILDLTQGGTGGLGLSMIGESGIETDPNCNIRLNFADRGLIATVRDAAGTGTTTITTPEHTYWSNNQARFLIVNDSGGEGAIFEEYQIMCQFIWDARKSVWLEKGRTANLKS